MIIEVSIRLIAYGKIFWKSAMNIFDVVLVALCIVSLIFLFMDCSTNRVKSELAGTVFLVIRNTIQFFRLFSALRKNQQHHTNDRKGKIEFSTDSQSEVEEGNYDTVHSGISPGYILEEDSDEESNLRQVRVVPVTK
ncbi:hypothetical protein K7432_014413 [Basidiobolus ranarum]|uniref:Uncharacterized protein n=1 Tax=Basidiobolus ranarum TaxID=34480 RepID=A0ABR2VPJ5_9FUNG